MAKKDVELFALEKRKNEALKKEWKKVAAREDKLKENQKEKFFNEKLYPIVKKYGFDFSFADFYECKKSKGSDEELSDDELFNVAGGALRLRKLSEKDRENPEYKDFFACGAIYASDPPRDLINPSSFEEDASAPIE